MEQIPSTYDAAYKELQEISMAIQTETITVDQLAEKVKRAASLIQFCEQKLRNTETEVTAIVSKMEKSKSGGA